MKTSGNTILITGGGSGIGLALAELLLDRGNKVIICGRRRDRLQAAKRRLPGLNIHVCDISRPRSRRGLVAWLTSEFKDLNILVNNAGIQRPIDFLKGHHHLPDADEEVDTNLTAPIHLSALLIPYLRRKKVAAIVNISSGLAFTPLAAVPVYCATKAAIHSLSLCLRFQLRATSVRVFEVAPPMVATELSGRRHRPDEDEDIMSSQAVATGIIDALKGDKYEVALGAAAHLRAQREGLFSAIND
ncbi:MAG: SDR family NAD(P)-dependent oxidoreductase [Candidatus Aminicenantales bacterium]